jgi:hypothetical protein
VIRAATRRSDALRPQRNTRHLSIHRTMTRTCAGPEQQRRMRGRPRPRGSGATTSFVARRGCSAMPRCLRSATRTSVRRAPARSRTSESRTDRSPDKAIVVRAIRYALVSANPAPSSARRTSFEAAESKTVSLLMARTAVLAVTSSSRPMARAETTIRATHALRMQRPEKVANRLHDAEADRRRPLRYGHCRAKIDD